MEGQGFIAADPKRNDGKGSLEYLVKNPATAERFKHLVDKDGKWVVRDDVWIWYLDRQGPLTVGLRGQGRPHRPGAGFRHVVGDALDDQVLLIKCAWGGKSLAKDFRPPSSGGEVGPYYKQIVQLTKDVLARLKDALPGVRRPRLRTGRLRLAPRLERPRQPGVQRRVRKEPGQLHPRHPQGSRRGETAVRDRRNGHERPGGKASAGPVADEGPGGRGRVPGVQGQRRVRRHEGLLARRRSSRPAARPTTGTRTRRPTT